MPSSRMCWLATANCCRTTNDHDASIPKELKAAFPPATNQHGESVWPVMLMLVAHELVSSCALPPEIGAMYGENNTSERKLTKQMAKRLPIGSVAMADSRSGIFSVDHAMVGEGHRILFRLTKSRFKALLRQTTRPRAPAVGELSR